MSAREDEFGGKWVSGYRFPGMFASFRGRRYRASVYSGIKDASLWINEDEAATFANVRPGTAPKAIVRLRDLERQPEVVSGELVARYRGKTFRVESPPDRRLGSQASVVLKINDDEVDDFTNVVARRGPIATLPLHELDGFIRVDIQARFAGREIQVMSIDERNVEFFANGPAWWASEHGLIGSLRDGFWGTVPRAQVESITVQVVDLLAREIRRKSKNL